MDISGILCVLWMDGLEDGRVVVACNDCVLRVFFSN